MCIVGKEPSPQPIMVYMYSLGFSTSNTTAFLLVVSATRVILSHFTHSEVDYPDSSYTVQEVHVVLELEWLRSATTSATDVKWQAWTGASINKEGKASDGSLGKRTPLGLCNMLPQLVFAKYYSWYITDIYNTTEGTA